MHIFRKLRNFESSRVLLLLFLATIFSSWFFVMASDPPEVETDAAETAAPSPPQLSAPENSAVIDCGKRKYGSVTLQWQGSDQAAAYHLELCEDAEFTTWIHDQKPVLGTEIEYTDLPPGIYFWRISSINEKHVEGHPSEIRQFEVEPLDAVEGDVPLIDTTPPKLKLGKPSIHGRFVIVTGTSERTASVWVNGQITVLDIETGKFVYIASMTKEGVHPIHVLAIDPAGNRSRKSVLVEIVE